MLSGCRRDEIASLSWGEIDFEGGLITLPSERTKNGYPHEITITKPIRAILEAQQLDSNGRELVFGRGAGGFQDFSGSKAELDQRIAAARERRGLGSMPAWVPHDFRRSVSTTMHEGLRIPPHVVEAVLGHVSGYKSGIRAVYNRSLYRDDKRVALERWDAMLMAAVNGKRAL